MEAWRIEAEKGAFYSIGEQLGLLREGTSDHDVGSYETENES